MGYTPFGQVLQMQGGSLQQKVGSVFAEKLKIIKALEGGGLSSSMLSGLLGGSGLSSIMQGTPDLTSALSSLQSSVEGLLSQVGGSSSDDPNPMTSTALTSLQTAATTLAANIAGLSGTGAAAPYAPIDLMLHYNTVGSLGAAPPSNLSFATASAPLTSQSSVTAAHETAEATVANLMAGTITDADAATAVTAQATTLSGIVAASSNAISGLQSALVVIATVEAFAAATVSGDQTLQTLLGGLVQPAVLADLQATAEAEYYIEPPTLIDQAPLINQQSAIATWIASYMTQTGSTTQTIEVR